MNEKEGAMKDLKSFAAVVVLLFMVTTGADARMYDPQEGRFLSKDPIGFAGGINVYAYVHNNPINWIDPFGLVDKNLFPPSQSINGYANAVPSPNNTYTVGAHGSPTSLVDENGLPVTVTQLANQINNDPASKGKDIQLMSCNIGVGQGSYAQQLADKSGRTVIAPDNYVWYYSNGNTVVAPPLGGNLSNGPDLTKAGSWNTFKPKGVP
ncbi:MAG TPA: hypothetical protein DEB35_04180 [Desulfuromonas sp.]|nr:hypothetical protein [Desulfuromonas sp.]